MTPEQVNSLERERVKRVAKAERESGFKEGGRVYDGQSCRVYVEFYPATKWWMEVGDKRYPLDAELWAQTSPLQL